MAKATNPTKNTSTSISKKNSVKHRRSWDLVLIDLLGRFGVSGTIVFVFAYIFLKYGTQAQYTEFIDKFVLFDIKKEDNFIYFFIAIIFGFMFLFQNIYFKGKGKLKDERISFLEEQVKDLDKRVKK